MTILILNTCNNKIAYIINLYKGCLISFESLKIDNKLKIICYIDEIEIANVSKLTIKTLELQNSDSKLMKHPLLLIYIVEIYICEYP